MLAVQADSMVAMQVDSMLVMQVDSMVATQWEATTMVSTMDHMVELIKISK